MTAEWRKSPIHPSAQDSSSDWVLQRVCRSCGSSTSMQDIPVLPAVSCPQCSSSAAIVFDRPTGRVVRFCVSCQLVVPHDGVSPPPQPPVEVPITLRLGTGLALMKSRMGVPPFSTGYREQVPSEQSQFWTAHALPIIRACADHFYSVDRCQPEAALLQSWPSGRLESVAQEVVTPPNIMSMIAVWLSDSVTQFRQGESASAPPPPPFPPPPDAPQPCHPIDPPSSSSHVPSPFTVVPSPSPPRPFCLSAAFNCPPCFREF